MSADDFPICDDNWQHRSRGMRCVTCMWYVAKAFDGPLNYNEEVVSFGRCRKHAPTLNGWPAVYGSDFCGDHKLDERCACVRWKSVLKESTGRDKHTACQPC